MKAFDEYVDRFDKNNKMISRKYIHSYRVMDVSKMLAQKLDLDVSDIELATLIGLLHDIGRFEQAKRYNTLSDINSVDHGDLGAYLLFDEGLISNFTTEKENYDIVKNCVKEHNKYTISNEYDKKTLLHLKIIRDADKIDIYNIFANLNEYEFNYDGEISDEVEKQFFSNKIIENEKKINSANWAVGVFSFVFDINFKQSFDYIKKQDFLKKIFDKINEKEKFQKYFDYAQKYVEENSK